MHNFFSYFYSHFLIKKIEQKIKYLHDELKRNGKNRILKIINANKEKKSMFQKK